MPFAILAVILVLFISVFVAFFVYIRRMDLNAFKSFCEKKIKRFARRNDLDVISKVSILNYARERLLVDHILFGKKYIYLVTDFLLKGFVSGEEKDNSWIYFDNIKRTHNYLNNLHKYSDKNIQEFAGILGVSEDFIVSVCLIPNECDFKIKNYQNTRKHIVRYSAFNTLVKTLEKQPIDCLDESQAKEYYKIALEKNNEKGNE